MTAEAPENPGEANPLISYVEEQDFPARLRPALESYIKRMGFLPNALKLYMHRPEIAETIWALNDKVMRDPSSTLDPFLKRRLGAVVSKINACTYCISHNCATLKNAVGGKSEGWGLSDDEVRALLADGFEPKDEFERVCLDFVRSASEDPGNVSEEIYRRLVKHLTPPQIIELACVVGFWNFYNTVHKSLRIPLESHLLSESVYGNL
ncbi:MAG: carboxymuconolactone decarboxylase family protein [Nitrospinota bacterium]